MHLSLISRRNCCTTSWRNFLSRTMPLADLPIMLSCFFQFSPQLGSSLNSPSLIRHFCKELLTDVQEVFLLWLTLLKIEREFTTSIINNANSMNCLLLNLWEKYRECNFETAENFLACCSSLYVWTWPLYTLRRFFKANWNCEIQRVPLLELAELWWYLNSFATNWNKSFSDLLFFSISDFVESWNLWEMQWELNINRFATSLIFWVHHSFYLTFFFRTIGRYVYHQW